jgi:hypothetical protein
MRLYFFSQLGGTLVRRLLDFARAPIRETDPIDHPDIAAMSLTKLADLPLWPDQSSQGAASAREARREHVRSAPCGRANLQSSAVISATTHHGAVK